MKASMFYRIAAVLLLLFAVGHTLGFRQSDPKWGVERVKDWAQACDLAILNRAHTCKKCRGKESQDRRPDPGWLTLQVRVLLGSPLS